MWVEIARPALTGVLPVAAFLAALLYLDSYKLVKLRTVIALVGCGAVVAGVSYLIDGLLLRVLAIDFTAFTRYVAPVTEELLKALVVVALIRNHRIGFLVDAAILGFAVGTGFAAIENLYYLEQVPDAGMGTWIVRGFGTAFMHGGATAIFAVMALALLERSPQAHLRAFAPGFAIALALHSGFNHLLLSPKLSTLTMLVVLPALLHFVFVRSDKRVGDWLGHGFDADTQMLELINSGRLGDSPIGKYLHTLKDRFKGPVVADVLCYLRLYTELAIRAKGILMMRENGFETAVDDETRAKFEEMRYLEQSIGTTALLAIHPMLHMSHKELWQLYMLGK